MSDDGSFKSRRPLPEPWRGLRDQELSKVSGISSGIFVHRSGFLGVWETEEAIMQVINLVLES